MPARDLERRGGVGEGVGRVLDRGAEGEVAGVGGDAEVVDTAVPPSSLTTTFSMMELDGLVVVGDRAGHRLVAGGDGDRAGVEGAAVAVGAGPGAGLVAEDRRARRGCRCRPRPPASSAV